MKGDNARLSHDERHADRLVEHQPLVVAAVLAEEVAVVARVEDERVLVVDAPQHAADAVVESFQGPQIVRDELRVGPAPRRVGEAPVREDVDATAARRALH